jgi:hypothetical protein
VCVLIWLLSNISAQIFDKKIGRVARIFFLIGSKKVYCLFIGLNFDGEGIFGPKKLIGSPRWSGDLPDNALGRNSARIWNQGSKKPFHSEKNT